jgi:hypothetical protein
MKAKNNREVVRAIVKFSAYLLSSAGLAVCICASFMGTSSVETGQILEKSAQDDLLKMKQIVLTETVDSLYYYSTLINTGDSYINHSSMLNMLSTKSILFSENLEDTGDECLIYRRLSARLGDFIHLKDSIRTAMLNLDVLRDEYIRCINNNRDMTRRLYTGSVY